MRVATKEHEKYHDCIAEEKICSLCFDFIPTDNSPFCSRARIRNMLAIPVAPACLKLGFLEQRIVALMHCYISVLIIRGHQSAMKGQVVHCQSDVAGSIGEVLPFPKCHEFMAVIQQKLPNADGEIKSTARYSVSAIQILKALQYLVQNHVAYADKRVLPLEAIKDLFECREETMAPIRIIDSYAYNNCSTSSPIILDASDNFFAPRHEFIQ